MGALLTLITLGICAPVAIVMVEKWNAKHTVINGKRLYFDGNGFQLIGKWIVWILLTIITIGIYCFFVAIRMKKWVVSHTHFEESSEEPKAVE